MASEILGQRDPRWSGIVIYNLTIGQVGCTSTVLSEIIGTTPDVFVSRMKAVNGFSGNLIIWAKIAEAFPGIQVYRYYGYDNAKVLAFVPNVIVEVPAAPIGGSGSHWVRFMGNKRLHDPWTAKDRPTSDFPNPTGFVIVQGKWNSAPVDHKKICQDVKSEVNSMDSDTIKVIKIRNMVASV